MSAPCTRTYRSLIHLALGEPCPCGHSPLVHTDNDQGCSVCLALDAAERAAR